MTVYWPQKKELVPLMTDPQHPGFPWFTYRHPINMFWGMTGFSTLGHLLHYHVSHSYVLLWVNLFLRLCRAYPKRPQKANETKILTWFASANDLNPSVICQPLPIECWLSLSLCLKCYTYCLHFLNIMPATIPFYRVILDMTMRASLWFFFFNSSNNKIKSIRPEYDTGRLAIASRF